MIIYKTKMCRHSEESDTESTDDDRRWGGKRMFECGAKGIVHALVHAPELVITGGHHGAYCTCLAEAAHKLGIKLAAKFTRTYAGLNHTQDNMLTYVLRRMLYQAVFELCDKLVQRRQRLQRRQRQRLQQEKKYLLQNSAGYTCDWQDLGWVHDHEMTATWAYTFISKKVLITRNELLVLLCVKLGMRTVTSNLLILLNQLKLRCFGSVRLTTPEGIRRKIVGFDTVSTRRRDFVRVNYPPVDNTSLSCQVGVYMCTNTRI